jgi:hypothetical protein
MTKEWNAMAGAWCREALNYHTCDHVPGRKILHRKAKRVKLHRTLIVSSKAMNI